MYDVRRGYWNMYRSVNERTRSASQQYHRKQMRDEMDGAAKRVEDWLSDWEYSTPQLPGIYKDDNGRREDEEGQEHAQRKSAVRYRRAISTNLAVERMRLTLNNC